MLLCLLAGPSTCSQACRMRAAQQDVTPKQKKLMRLRVLQLTLRWRRRLLLPPSPLQLPICW